MTTVLSPELVMGGFGYLESPRWHQGSLWMTDMQERRVVRFRSDGQVSSTPVDFKPGGLGFLPGGDRLIVGMDDHRIHRLAGSQTRLHADLSELSRGKLNDMVVTGAGAAYVGMFGYDLASREKPRPAPLIHVSPGGAVQVAADELLFANGMFLLDQDRTLIVAETAARRLTEFSVRDDGSLGDRRVFADISPRAADGICADAEGGVWIGCPFTSEFVRVERGGRVTHVIPTPDCWSVACAFGDRDCSLLYLLIASTSMDRFHRGESVARIEAVTAPVPGA